MRILHIDLRTLNADLDAEYATLRYGWENLNDFQPRRLPLAEIQDLIDRMEVGYYTALPEDYAQTGQRLYQWLDGSDRWLAQRLSEAAEGVVLAIATEARLGHLPWEVLHDGEGFLVGRTFPVVLPVRWQAGRGSKQALSWQAADAAANRPLQALFMATSPLGVEPVLNFEAEEGRILAATERQPMTLQVEESGCLSELEDLLTCYEPGHFDVVHLTGHAWISEEGPRFITESETGARVDASPQEIARSLQFRFPALLFLSGCRTGQAGKGGEVPSMAGALIEAGAKAVLGWGRPVLDTDGILAAEQLYKALAGAKTLAEALALTYQAMIAAKARDWHLLRLYVTGAVPQNLVTPKRTKGRKAAPKASMTTAFLDAAGKVKVPGRGSFVGRRRPLQNCLRSLQDPEMLGVLLTGMGGLGKSSLAARLCDRLTDYARVVLFGELDEAGLVRLLADAVQDAELRQRLQDPDEALRYRLREVFQTETEPTFLLVLDDFEANLEPVGDKFRLKERAAEVLTELVWALEQSELGHRVIITCRYGFEFTGLAKFYRQPLAALAQADLQKKCQQLAAFGQKSGIEEDVRERALALADGNPRLLEWLDKVLQAPGAVSVAALLDALEGERRAELREQVLAAALLAQVDGPMREMLARALVYELPVPRVAIMEVCEGVEGVEGLVERAVALGLLEQSPDGDLRVPRVLPLEKVEDEELAARAAQVLYRLWWEEESSSELQRLEVHRLAVLGSEKKIVTTVGDAIAINWKNKGRYREAVELCEKTVSIARDYALLHTLALAESALGNMDVAISLFEEAFENCPEDDAQEKGAIIHNWAIRKATQGDVDGAIALYQQALEIQEKIGNAQGKAATLGQMAHLYEAQGDVEKAFELHRKAGEIAEKIGHVAYKATSMHCMAAIKAQQGDVDGAIALYQQSLDIKEKIGNAQGKAATLHQMAAIKAQQGDVDGAIALYQQSLEITEKIGDAFGKAATLAMLGQLLADAKGDKKTAIDYLSQSLTILQKIGSPDAHAVQGMLDRISGKGNVSSTSKRQTPN